MSNLTKRAQLTLVPEVTEGTAVPATSIDGYLGLDVNFQIDRNMIERNEASPSLANVASSIGRGTFGGTYGLDLKGRGTKIKPEFSLPLRMSGMREIGTSSSGAAAVNAGTCIRIVVSGLVGTPVVGETITGANAGGHQNSLGRIYRVVNATTIDIAVIGQKHFADLQAIAGYTSGFTASIAGVPNFQPNVWCYIPWSRRALYIPLVAGLTNTPPLNDLDGYALLVKRAGVPIAGGSVRRYDETATTKALYADMVWGSPLSADTVEVTITGGPVHGATLSADPSFALGWVPPVTIRHNVDGAFKEGFGARSTFKLAGAVGETGMLEFTVAARIGSKGDAALIPALTFQADGAPIRIAGANFLLDSTPWGLVPTNKKIPFANFELALNASTPMRPDGNAPEGDLSAIITKRDPTITIDPEWVPTTSLDLATYWADRTLITMSCEFGTGAQKILFHALKCQVHSLGTADRDGLMTGSLVLKPRAVHGDGDDEFMLVCLS